MGSDVAGGQTIFGLELGDFLATLALCIAIIIPTLTLVVTYSRGRKSEQIKIARETRDTINVAHDRCNTFMDKDLFPEGGSTDDKNDWLTRYLLIIENISYPVRYFTFLATEKEIKNRKVLKYYKDSILQTLAYLEIRFADVERMATVDGVIILTPDRASWVARHRQEVLENREFWEHIPTLSFWKRIFSFKSHARA
jgi:hypothetical protein